MKNFHFSVPILLLFAGCATFSIPKTYVPDEKVVFLTQSPDFNPVRYDPVPADPYTFSPDLTTVDPVNPKFLKDATWDRLKQADFRADSRTYREVSAHFTRILGLPEIQKLRTILDAEVIVPPSALPPVKGDKVKDYTNGAVYTYPDAEGAQITILNGGYYEIDFADKGFFRFQEDGSYQRSAADGTVLFSSDPHRSLAVVSRDGLTFTSAPRYRSLVGPEGTLTYNQDPEPQYNFSPKGGAPGTSYTLFIDEKKEVIAVALLLANGLRFDYFPQDAGDQKAEVLVTNGSEALAINAQYEKVHLGFDPVKRKATNLLSEYLPEGICLTNLDSANPAYGIVRSNWPEGYLTKAMGPFDVLYTAKDEALVAKLDGSKMTSIETGDRKLTGLGALGRRTLVIPPDLDSYRKLNVTRPGEILLWYPSGFETKDLIVMWPISVPRYDTPAGQDYFLKKEFYEILTHEYVHVLVGENSGLRSPVPVWLNEGLAVYAESLVSPQVKAAWDVTFDVSRGLGRLLSWDLVTTTSTGELEVSKARVEYAQSYALVGALVKRFGSGKVAEYIRSFRVKTNEIRSENLTVIYKVRFKEVFGTEFDQALKLLDPPAQ